jgi:hypothetical protein
VPIASKIQCCVCEHMNSYTGLESQLDQGGITSCKSAAAHQRQLGLKWNPCGLRVAQLGLNSHGWLLASVISKIKNIIVPDQELLGLAVIMASEATEDSLT